MSILAVQNLMQWEKLLEKARRVWFNRKWKQVVVYVRKQHVSEKVGANPSYCFHSGKSVV